MRKILNFVICVSLAFQIFQGFMVVQSFNFINDNPTSETMVVYEKWSFATNNSISTALLPFDLEADGIPEIIFGTEDGHIYCVNSTGSSIWSYDIGDIIFATPAIEDLNGDGYLEIVFGSYDNNIHCITPVKEGNNITIYENWIYTTGDVVETCPSIVDIDADGDFEILIGSTDYILYCLSNVGLLKWSYTTGGPFYNGTALGIADLDNDNDLEILAGTDALYCIDDTGELVWKTTETQDVSYSSPTVRDFYGDGSPEIFIGSIDNKIYCFDADGNLEWEYATGGDIFSSAAIGDVAWDSANEIIIGSNDGSVYSFYGNGTLCWEFATGDEVWASPSIADLDGDGWNYYETLIGSKDNHFYCINCTGNQVWNFTLQGPVRTPSLVIDLDADGILEILFGTSYLDDGKIYCLGLSGIGKSGRASWYCYRSSFQNLGAIDYDSDLLDHSSEIAYGTDFRKNDTDYDGWYDGIEVLAGTNPLDINDYPPNEQGDYTPITTPQPTTIPTTPSNTTTSLSFVIPGFIIGTTIASLTITNSILILITKRKQK